MNMLSLFVLACTVVLSVEGQGSLNCTRQNEEYACGNGCQLECANLEETCPPINGSCYDECYCIEGYARNNTGVCIDVRACPRP